MSLGVVTFSKAQADMVTVLLELERRRDEVLNDFLREGHAEDASRTSRTSRATSGT